jgi:hypothetical protein
MIYFTENLFDNSVLFSNNFQMVQIKTELKIRKVLFSSKNIRPKISLNSTWKSVSIFNVHKNIDIKQRFEPKKSWVFGLDLDGKPKTQKKSKNPKNPNPKNIQIQFFFSLFKIDIQLI